MITTSAVILELGAHFSHSSGRRSFLRLIELLRQANVEIVHVDPMLQGRGIGLFAARADKDWSLADCLSFLVMKDRGILESATSDEHFEQAGFIALLRQPSPNP
jgi:predicted nucleic acid-binding protein